MLARSLNLYLFRIFKVWEDEFDVYCTTGVLSSPHNKNQVSTFYLFCGFCP